MGKIAPYEIFYLQVGKWTKILNPLSAVYIRMHGYVRSIVTLS